MQKWKTGMNETQLLGIHVIDVRLLWLENLILSGFVGSGLVFAGITDTCALGMLLAKMPWNQRI